MEREFSGRVRMIRAAGKGPDCGLVLWKPGQERVKRRKKNVRRYSTHTWLGIRHSIVLAGGHWSFKRNMRYGP